MEAKDLELRVVQFVRLSKQVTDPEYFVGYELQYRFGPDDIWMAVPVTIMPVKEW